MPRKKKRKKKQQEEPFVDMIWMHHDLWNNSGRTRKEIEEATAEGKPKKVEKLVEKRSEIVKKVRNS